MLRVLLVLLALANAGYLAWSRGWLDGVVGVRAAGDREPERVKRQVQPELVQIVPPGPTPSAASAAATAAPAGSAASAGDPLACLEAGPFAERDLAAAEAAVRAVVPAGQWHRVAVDGPGAWRVYIGRFATAAALAKQEGELKRRGIEYEPTTAPPALDPGFALGRYADRAAAEAALADFSARGVPTARVIAPEPLSDAVLLRVEPADTALAARLAALRDPALGTGFVACGDR